MGEFDCIQITDSEDFVRLGTIGEQCFLSSPGESEVYIKRIGRENFRVIRRDQEILGGLAIISMGQWWGGVSVPMGGIAAVSIAPEYRGCGAALTMMQQTVKELYTQGIAISALYPATQYLYRQVGYEQAGHYCLWEIPTQSIQIKEQPLPFVRVAANSHEAFHQLYQQQAKLINGYLDRNQVIWLGVIQPDEKTLYAYLIGSAEQPQGYIIFSQHSIAEGTILRIKDWVMLTPAAVQSFWSFLAKHRSQIEKVRWRSSINDHLSLLLPEQTAKMKNTTRWMVRIIDVVKALSLRSYPSLIETELHLEITDNLIAPNNGKFILSVAKGRGEVTKGGRGELQLDIRELVPLYTGLFAPQQLHLKEIDTQIFAGASPWMADFF